MFDKSGDLNIGRDTNETLKPLEDTKEIICNQDTHLGIAVERGQAPLSPPNPHPAPCSHQEPCVPRVTESQGSSLPALYQMWREKAFPQPAASPVHIPLKEAPAHERRSMFFELPGVAWSRTVQHSQPATC